MSDPWEHPLMERDETLFAQQQVVRLQALLEASRRIHSTIALDVVLDTVLEIVVRELELTGAFFTHFPQTYGDVPPGFAGSAGNSWVVAADPGPAAELAISPDTWLRFPLRDKAGVPFTELVVLRPEDRTLTLDELDFIESLAIQSAVAIENARFHERTVQWERVQSDLEAARGVQRSLLPQKMPDIPGYALAARSQACYEVGGDYFDIVPTESGRTTIVVADVAGKGLASALIGTSFRSAFRAMVNSRVPLLEIATRMNLLHYNEGPESRRRYVTALFLELDPAANSIAFVNAGHNPPFLLHADPASGPSQAGESDSLHRIHASGTPIGMLPAASYAVEQFTLRPGARLLLYTDGLTEVFRGEEEFGEQRLLENFIACEPCTPAKMLDSLWKQLDEFTGEPEPTDDMTALLLLRQPEPYVTKRVA